MGNNRIQQLNEFFNRYAARFANALNGAPDLEETAKSFSDCFISASPSGVMCGNNNEDFTGALQQGYAFYRGIGIRSMEILSIHTTLLDDLHEMTTIRWRSGYVKDDSTQGSMEFDNIYFTQTKENESKIFAYITGDEQASLKEAGLI